jgi:agmatinase
MLPVTPDLIEESTKIRSLVTNFIESDQPGNEENPVLNQINTACENLNIHIKSITKGLLQQGKRVGLVGGDHSTPLGFLKSLNEVHDRFGILHIDAHMDLRRAYQGFTFSHGSIMFNALKLSAVSRIVQVGIRDYCEEEFNNVKRSMGRVAVFFDEDLKTAQFNGTQWDEICNRILKELPEKVYISFDIDGLNPSLCPNTGTPVPGGLDYDQAVYLLDKLVKSGKEIIGFDLSEVAPGNGNDWDANVGARILYQLCNTILSY